jgi:hypothetical protein
MLKRILMSSPVEWVITILFVLALSAATMLIEYLSHGTIPPRLEPIAARWVNAGYDPKSFRFLLWLCFWFLAAIFFAVVGWALYFAATDLGRNLN